MAKNIFKIKTKESHRSIVTFIKSKTTLFYPDIDLVIDLFVFFLKKILIENEKVVITGFGRLYTRKFPKKGILIRFKAIPYAKILVSESKIVSAKNFAKIRKSQRAVGSPKKTNGEIKKAIIYISKILKLDKDETKLLFNFFIQGIFRELLTNRICKIRGFGSFYLFKYKFKRRNVCGKPKNISNKIMIKFKPLPRFLREVNRKEKEIFVLNRLKNILLLNKFNEFEIENASFKEHTVT